MTLHDIEKMVHAGIDAGDCDTVEAYAEHCLDNLDSDLMRDLFEALIRNDATSRNLALIKIGARIDRQRAEFIEFEAMRLVKQLEDREVA